MNDFASMNQQVIDDFRAHQGRVGPPFEGAPIVLLHHVGRKSGDHMVTPMMYQPDADNPNDIVYVFASKAGAPTNPGWYYNITTAGRARVERGTEEYDVTVRELPEPDRTKIYAKQAELFPGFAGYAEKTEGVRVIPVIELARA